MKPEVEPEVEKALQKALRRTEPAPDFAERVMARIAEQSPQAMRVDERLETFSWWRRLAEFFQFTPMKWAVAGALASLLVVGLFGVRHYREQQRLQAEMLAAEQAEGERAKEQVMLALQIASAKLNVAQRKVKESSQ